MAQAGGGYVMSSSAKRGFDRGYKDAAVNSIALRVWNCPNLTENKELLDVFRECVDYAASIFAKMVDQRRIVYPGRQAGSYWNW